ncbi:MAG: hypothetical protein GY725_15345 [bacterium]|nr:hypothetical protein [bacterium]
MSSKKPWLDNAPNVNALIQSIAIVIGGSWVLYIFVYQEYWVPRSLPSHLAGQLEIEISGTSSSHIALRSVLHVQNPSSQRVHVMPSVFVAWGSELDGYARSSKQFLQRANENLRTLDDDYATFHEAEPFDLAVHVAPVLTDWYLDAGESASEGFFFHVPRDKYDSVVVKAIVLSAKDSRGIDIQWKMGEDHEARFEIFQTRPHFEKLRRLDTTTDKDVDFLNEIEFALIEITDAVSLWDQEDSSLGSTQESSQNREEDPR